MSDFLKRILDARDEVSGRVVSFLQEYGINPVYAATLFVVVVTLLHWKEFKKWDDLPKHRQKFLKSMIFVNIVMIVGSLLHLLGAW